MHNLVTVDFRGDILFAVERDDAVFVAIKPICERLGLVWNGQLERLKRNPILLEGMRVIRIPSVGGDQDTACLALRYLNGWLFGIDSARVKPELRERVLAYQRECYDVLADHFLGPRAAAEPIRMPEGAPDADIRLREWHEKMVGRVERIFGKAAARAQWVEFGYTDHSRHLPPGGEAASLEADAELDPDDAVAAVRDFLRDQAGRFVPATAPGNPATWEARGLPGFRTADGDFLVIEAGWREALQGLPARAAADALAAAGLLLKSPAGERKRSERVGNRTMRVYRVRARIVAA